MQMYGLDELDLSDDDFYEKEIDCLDNLPRTQEGLLALVEYLEQYDSYVAWQIFFQDFSNIATVDVYKEMLTRAKGIWDYETMGFFLQDKRIL